MSTEQQRRPLAALAGGTVIGTLGELIGLGGAEFRLPLLLSVFRFPPLEAIILNKYVSVTNQASGDFFYYLSEGAGDPSMQVRASPFRPKFVDGEAVAAPE